MAVPNPNEVHVDVPNKPAYWGRPDDYVLVDDILKALWESQPPKFVVQVNVQSGRMTDVDLERLSKQAEAAMNKWANEHNISAMKHGVPSPAFCQRCLDEITEKPKPHLAECTMVMENRNQTLGKAPEVTHTDMTFRIPPGGINVRCTYDLPKKMVTKEAGILEGKELSHGWRGITFGVPASAKVVRCTYEVEASEVSDKPAFLRKIMD